VKLREYITSWSDAPIDWEPTWIIENVWQFGALNFLAGPPKKARKSSLRRYLTACAISGKSAFGVFPVRRRVERVLSFVIEDHPGMERRAIQSILDAHGHTRAPHIDFIRPLGFHLNNPHHLNELLALKAAEGYDLITFDPLIEFHGVDENSSSEMSQVAIALRKIMDEAGIVLIHHTSKPPSDGPAFTSRTLGESMRGSSVLGGVFDTMIRSYFAGKGRVKLDFEIKLPVGSEPDAFEVEIDQDTWLWRTAAPLTEDAVLQQVRLQPGITRSELVTQLARRRSDVLKIVKVMVRNGLLREEWAQEDDNKPYFKLFAEVPAAHKQASA
jgi:hypothetical protein